MTLSRRREKEIKGQYKKKDRIIVVLHIPFYLLIMKQTVLYSNDLDKALAHSPPYLPTDIFKHVLNFMYLA